MTLAYKVRCLAEVTRANKESKAGAERERWGRERLERWQRERLNALARYAVERSPFWRSRLSGSPEDIQLQDLPVLDKPTMMEHFDELVTDPRLRRDALLEHLEGLDHDALYLGQYRAMTTSGSSGLKGLFVYDRPAWVALLAQFFRYSTWAGNQPTIPRRRIAAIGGAGPTHMTRRLASTLNIGFHRMLSLPVTMPIRELVARLNAFQPQWMNAYPSVAGLLADEQEAGRLRLRLEGMSTSSELRGPELAARLEAAFGVKPMDFYATTEGLWGCECERRAGVHLFEDLTLVENVDEDGRPVPPGEPGARLLVTNLFNTAQPLIRFEVPDVLTLDPSPCPCGRSLRRLLAIDGRHDDVLKLGGVSVLPLHFGVLTADADVRQFQVVQEGEGVRLRLVLREGADPDAARQRLEKRVAAKLADVGVTRPHVVADVCLEIPRGGGGKVQLVIADRHRTQAPAPS